MSEHIKNLLHEVPTHLSEELVEVLVSRPHCRVERIVSTGQVSPPDFWYDQAEDEWVLLLSGEAEIGFKDGASQYLHPGDSLMIPAHCMHRVNMTSQKEPTIWLVVFSH